MIPSDVAARLQLTTDAAVTRVPTAQQVTDALADLVPGQRVLAEIQALLPNGAYRALINQRDVTLALPFSAKSGDSLELEVVDQDGKLALALVGRRSETASNLPPEQRPAVETTLSRTGNFIAGLLARQEGGEGARPALLNANQPIAPSAPNSSEALVPLLRQAIHQSGMFYESHQAQWVSSRMPVDALLAEPQGRHSAVTQPPGEATAAASITASRAQQEGEARSATAPGTTTAETARPTQPALPPGQLVAPDLVPLVQQQLEALASQTYVWQGQAWPGQPMRWEIEEDGHRNTDGEPDAQTQWQTRLTLTMPELGEVRAAIRISGGEIAMTLSAGDNAAAMRLAGSGEELRKNLEAAGLTVAGFTVGRHEQEEG